jgi:hypothetical protein
MTKYHLSSSSIIMPSLNSVLHITYQMTWQVLSKCLLKELFYIA